jgi:hypothetical protein
MGWLFRLKRKKAMKIVAVIMAALIAATAGPALACSKSKTKKADCLVTREVYPTRPTQGPVNFLGCDAIAWKSNLKNPNIGCGSLRR